MSAPSPVQLRVLRYLVACEHASDKAVAAMLWGNPRQYRRASVVLRRLQGRGLVELWAGGRDPGARRSWAATPAGVEVAQ